MSEDSTTEYDILVALLGASSARKREPALIRLGEAGEPAIIHLVGRLRDGDPRTRYLVARAFGRGVFDGLHDRSDVADALVAALDDDHAPVVATLVTQLTDPWYAIRFAAVAALGHLGSPDVVAPLWRMVTDPNSLVRGRTVDILISLRADGVLPVACRILRTDPDYFVREWVASGLARIGGDEAVTALREALGDEVGFVRHNALQSLVALLGRAALDDVRTATRDPSEYNRDKATRLLTMLGGDPA